MDVSFSSIATFILVLIENLFLFEIKAFIEDIRNHFFIHMKRIHAKYGVFCIDSFSNVHHFSFSERLMRCVTAHIYTGGDSF